MITRDAIIAEARAWIGTPSHWQASVKGVGCDCKGLVWGVARELAMPEADSLHARIANYGAKVDARLLRRGLAETLVRTREPLPGDVILLVLGGKPQHLAILSAPGRMIHTYGKGPHRVIEVPVGKSREIDSFWTWPSLGASA